MGKKLTEKGMTKFYRRVIDKDCYMIHTKRGGKRKLEIRNVKQFKVAYADDGLVSCHLIWLRSSIDYWKQ